MANIHVSSGRQGRQPGLGTTVDALVVAGALVDVHYRDCSVVDTNDRD